MNTGNKPAYVISLTKRSSNSRFFYNTSKSSAQIYKLIIMIILILVIAFLFSISGQDGKTALIMQEKEILYRINLARVKNEYEILIEGNRGITNNIIVKPGEIGIKNATCPDKVCVKTGFIKNGKIPIICLPNRLEIKIINDKTSETPDAVT